MASSSGTQLPPTTRGPSSTVGSYVWTCHQCTNINVVDVRNNEPSYNGDMCEHDYCNHKRCYGCGSSDVTQLPSTPTLDRIPIRLGIKRYRCAFHELMECRKPYFSWLDAERCARFHFTGGPFVPCSMAGCVRNFASLDHYREHLQTDHGVGGRRRTEGKEGKEAEVEIEGEAEAEAEAEAEEKPKPLPVEYVVLLCPFRLTTNCQEISYSLRDLQDHFQLHLAAVPNRPQVPRVRDCMPRPDGRYRCRYADVFNCTKVFNTPLPEKQHFIKHFPRLLPCPLCEREFRLPEWVDEHLKTHVDDDKANIGE